MLENNVEAAWAQASSLFGDNATIEATRGEYNSVLLVSTPDTEDAVIKIPGYQPGYDTTKILDREEAIVRLVDSKIVTAPTFPFDLPTVLHTSQSPRWAVFSFVAGKVLTREVIFKTFSEQDYTLYGRRIGQFVAQFGGLIEADEFAAKIDAKHGPCLVDRETRLRAMWPVKYQELRDQNYGQLAEVFAQICHEYESLKKEGALKPTMIGHDDLHSENCAFMDSDESRMHLTGIFDLGNVKLSNPARELRFMPLLGAEATNAALASYEEATGEQVSKRVVDFWGKVQCVVGCIGIIRTGKSLRPSVIKSMNYMCPDFDWVQEFESLG